MPIVRAGFHFTTRTIIVQTRGDETEIVNEYYTNHSPAYVASMRNTAVALRKRFSRGLFRGEVLPAYNCHGLTFASRRTCIHEPSDVREILKQDGYKRVTDEKSVMAGDVIIYLSNGDIEHSGVVLMLDGFVPLILSKWGQTGPEVVHRANDCPYDYSVHEFYRVVK